MKKTARKPGPGISRIDQDSTRTHGYFVRVGYQLTSKGWRPRMSAFFGDASHKGADGALRAARSWQKRAMAEVDGRGGRGGRRSATKKSGGRASGRAGSRKTSRASRSR